MTNTLAVSDASHGGASINKGHLIRSRNPQDFPPLTSKQEQWRFTPLRRLRGLGSLSERDASTSITNVEYTVGFVGDTPADWVSPVRVERVPVDDPRVGSGGLPSDRVAAEALHATTEATIVHVPKEKEVPYAIHIKAVSQAEGVSAGHLVIKADLFSKATIVLSYTGQGTIADNVELILAPESQVTVILVSDLADDAVHVGSQVISLGRNSALQHFVALTGSELERLSFFVNFTAPGASSELYGLYFAHAGQHLEQHILVDHAVANCRSMVHYKGALYGEGTQSIPDAHTVWVGDVLIRAEASGTETYEINRNLLLSTGARADSVPNLEIETGEIVGAGHASAVGKFDEEQLFYLLSRGMSEADAKRLIVRGFFGEIISKIPHKTLRTMLDNRIEKELNQAGV